MINIKYSDFDKNKCKTLLNYFNKYPLIKEYYIVFNQKIKYEMVDYYNNKSFNYDDFYNKLEDICYKIKEEYGDNFINTFDKVHFSCFCLYLEALKNNKKILYGKSDTSKEYFYFKTIKEYCYFKINKIYILIISEDICRGNFNINSLSNVLDLYYKKILLLNIK